MEQASAVDVVLFSNVDKVLVSMVVELLHVDLVLEVLNSDHKN